MGKYFKYAVGEIILVVIGILIALYINNRNEARLERDKERQYLYSLREEFLRNKEEAGRVLVVSEKILQSSTRLANWTDPKTLDISNALIEKNIAQTFAEPPKYIQSPGILNDLISSGHLNKISSEKLRLLIQEWLAVTKDVEDEEAELWRHRFKFMDLMNQKISFKNLLSSMGYLSNLENVDTNINFDSDSKELIKDRYFENLLFIYIVNLNALKQIYYPRLETNIDSIIKEIDHQL